MSFEEGNKDFKIGSLVWAKISKKDPFWPGLVVELEDCGLQEKRSADKICIFWIGDDRVSMVLKKNIQEFTSSFKENCKLKPPRLKQAILLSIEIHMERAYDINLASCSDEMKISHMLSKHCIPKDNLEIPNSICLVLRKIRHWNSSDDEEESDSGIEKITKTEEENSKVIEDIRKGILKISDVCIICCKKTEGAIMHPFFTGGLCLPCKVSYRDSVFSMNSMGSKILCIVCGKTEGKFQARQSFLWLFCKKCALQYFNASEKDIRINWNTFLKNKNQKRANGTIIMKVNEKWEENIIYLFEGEPEIELLTPKKETHFSVVYLCTSEPSNKKGLFKVNNFGFTLKTVEFITMKDLKQRTENIAFDSQNLLVGRACEINEVWISNHQQTEEMKEEIVEFFIEFTTVISRSKNVMWFFEIPAAIQSKLRLLISRFLNCHPVVTKLSTSRSPLNQYRLVWTNMNLTTEYIMSFHQHFYEL